MGAHFAPNVMVIPLGEQQPIQFTHPLTTEGPGIVLDMFNPAPHHPHLVAHARIAAQFDLMDPGMVGGLHRQGLAVEQQLHHLGLRHPDPHHPGFALEELGTQHGEWIVVAAFRQPLGVLHHPIKAEHGHEPAASDQRA